MSIYIKFINQKCHVLFHYINDIYNNLNGTKVQYISIISVLVGINLIKN